MIIKMAKRSIFIGVLLFSVLLVSCKTAGKVNFPEGNLADGKEANVQRVTKSDEQESAIAKANTKGTDSMNKEEILAKEAAILNARDLAAGTVLEPAALGGLDFDELFYIKKIDDNIKTRINGKSYKEDCDVPYDDLRYIRVLHKNFEGKTQVGELIINKSVAEDVLDIFKELYDADYPIERMVLIDEYDAEDNASMAANNSSAFNFRFIDGTTKRSSHSDGLAIDINPLYNPYVRTRNGKEVVLPENGTEYADRTKENPYYIKKDDICYQAFSKRGFTWGGEWKSSKDYQHFQKIN
jgi:hypothetical protein